MNNFYVFLIIVLTFMLINCTPDEVNTKTNQSLVDPGISFVRCKGRQLIDSKGSNLYLRGIAFGNRVWENPTIPPLTHHGENDYRNIASLGFNTVRFYLNYNLFESDMNPFSYRQTGFTWLNKNIEWAKKNNIYLILNLHVPQGGFQSTGQGGALWEDKKNQQRFIALWREIAWRYAHESIIIGYGILNEPLPTQNIEQWESLARETAKAIRQVDPNHIIIIERTLQIGLDIYNDDHNSELNFAVVDDPNVMYELHFYKPFAFTHQRTWIPAFSNVVTCYPSEDIYEVSGKLLPVTVEPHQLVDMSDIKKWFILKCETFTIADPKKKVGIPVIIINNIDQNGTVWCDAITVKEFDPDNNLISTRSCIIKPESPWIYLIGEVETIGVLRDKASIIVPHEGRNHTKAALKINGPAQHVYMAGIFEIFPLKQGHTYEVSGWFKDLNINKNATLSISLLCMDTDGQVLTRGKSYIQSELIRLDEWAKKMNVPLYLGEFGCIRKAFMENLGALQWVADVIDICEELGIHYSFHSYHEESFGLYWNSAAKPINSDEVNHSLLRLFQEKQLK